MSDRDTRQTETHDRDTSDRDTLQREMSDRDTRQAETHDRDTSDRDTLQRHVRQRHMSDRDTSDRTTRQRHTSDSLMCIQSYSSVVFRKSRHDSFQWLLVEKIFSPKPSLHSVFSWYPAAIFCMLLAAHVNDPKAVGI